MAFSGQAGPTSRGVSCFGIQPWVLWNNRLASCTSLRVNKLVNASGSQSRFTFVLEWMRELRPRMFGMKPCLAALNHQEKAAQYWKYRYSGAVLPRQRQLKSRRI